MAYNSARPRSRGACFIMNDQQDPQPTDTAVEPSREHTARATQGAAAPSPGGPAAGPGLLRHEPGEEHPLREMFRIAAPTVVTMTSYTVMQFIDALMVSRIQPPSPVYVAAQGNGGMAAWLPIAFMMGLLGIINSYVSQNLGAGKPERGAAYAWNGLWLTALFALLLLPYAAVLPHFYAMMGHSEELRRLETEYGQILVCGAFLTLGARCLAHYFYGMHRPLVVMFAALAGNTVNLCANFVLIFGFEAGPVDIPAMGVAGAAFATLLGAAVELSIPLGLFLGPTLNRRFGTRAAWRPSAMHVRDLLRLGWPGGMMFANEMACWFILMVYLIGTFGEIHQAAGWIAMRYMHISFMPAVGLSIAVTAIVGRSMGRGRPDLAEKRAWLGLVIATIYMGSCAVAFVLFREPMIMFLADENLDPEAAEALIRAGAVVMIAAAVFQLFDAIAIIMTGALRGAGDTIWPGVATVVLSWTCIVGIGKLMILYFPQLGSLGPWIGAATFIILLGTVLLWRFQRGHWKTLRLVHDNGQPAADEGPSADADHPTVARPSTLLESPESDT